MDELIISGELLSSSEPKELDCGVVREVASDGILISVGAENLKKKYSAIVTGQNLSAGDRVLVAHVSGTYIIIGKIGT